MRNRAVIRCCTRPRAYTRRRNLRPDDVNSMETLWRAICKEDAVLMRCFPAEQILCAATFPSEQMPCVCWPSHLPRMAMRVHQLRFNRTSPLRNIHQHFSHLLAARPVNFTMRVSKEKTEWQSWAFLRFRHAGRGRKVGFQIWMRDVGRILRGSRCNSKRYGREVGDDWSWERRPAFAGFFFCGRVLRRGSIECIKVGSEGFCQASRVFLPKAAIKIPVLLVFCKNKQ